MDISVVVPTADRPSLLLAAIASVHAQTVLPQAIVVVDNGEQAFASHSTLDVRVIRTPPRIGAAAARNCGLAYSTSEYIAFLDDDDLWPPNFLSTMLEAIEGRKADVAVAPLHRLKARDATAVPWKQLFATPEELQSVYWRNPGFTGSNVVYRRAALMAVGGFSEAGRLSPSEDRDLLARLMQSSFRIIGSGTGTFAVHRDHESADRLSRAMFRARLEFTRRHWCAMPASARIRAVLSPLRSILWRFRSWD